LALFFLCAFFEFVTLGPLRWPFSQISEQFIRLPSSRQCSIFLAEVTPMKDKKDKTLLQGMRFRESELNLARREAKRLGSCAGDVIRAALLRIIANPLLESETQAVKLAYGGDTTGGKRGKKKK
jgi:hypothetical protein